MILQITWWNGTRELTDTQKWRIAHENGTGAAKSRVALILSRAGLGRKLVCPVEVERHSDLGSTRAVLVGDLVNENANQNRALSTYF